MLLVVDSDKQEVKNLTGPGTWLYQEKHFDPRLFSIRIINF